MISTRIHHRTDRVSRTRGYTWRLVAAAAAGVVVLAGCSSGPADVADGQYRAFAWSGVGDPGASVLVTGDQLDVSSSAGTEALAVGDPANSYVLCPPDGTGRPRLLNGRLAIGDLVMRQPAVFGDCGTTSPRRLTIVDIASYDPSQGPFPFTTWVEFCDVKDADCS